MIWKKKKKVLIDIQMEENHLSSSKGEQKRYFHFEVELQIPMFFFSLELKRVQQM